MCKEIFGNVNEDSSFFWHPFYIESLSPSNHSPGALQPQPHIGEFGGRLQVCKLELDLYEDEQITLKGIIVASVELNTPHHQRFTALQVRTETEYGEYKQHSTRRI